LFQGLSGWLFRRCAAEFCGYVNSDFSDRRLFLRLGAAWRSTMTLRPYGLMSTIQRRMSVPWMNSSR